MLPSFLLNMTSFPEMVRNVAVAGHLHHGKTALMDMLVFETHKLIWDADKPVCIVSTLVIYLVSLPSRRATQTLIYYQGSGTFPLNQLRCHLFYPLPPENLI
jgi:hypothetical protein